MSHILIAWVLPILVLLMATAAWLLSVFGLPGNWTMVLVALLYGWFEGFRAVPWWVIAVGVAAALAGEAAELAGAYLGGGARGGHWMTGLAAVAGSIVGALVGAMFFWGLGALPGTIIGAFLAAMAAEVVRHREGGRAFRVSLGAAAGRALGLVVKLGLGAGFLALLYVRVIWTMAAGR